MVLKKKDYPYVPGQKPAWSSIKIKKVDYADVLCIGFEPATIEYDGTELDTWQYWKVVYINTGHEHSKFMGDKPNWFEEGLELKAIPITKLHYHGWCGVITIGAYNDQGNIKEIGTVSSGLTDELREKIKQEPDKYKGRVCMVQVMEKFESALRHPIFKGFRDDKNARECTIESIFS